MKGNADPIESKFRSDLFRRGERVFAAVSGGSDSMCLLSLLVKYRERLGIELSCVHVEHGMREESKSDAEFVENFCKSSGVPFRLFHVDVPAYCRETGASAEEGARTLRYRCFETLFSEGSADVAAIAHNAGDLAETVLFNLARGTGVSGLCSMRAVSGSKSRYLRPLLDVTRAEISAYLNRNGIPFAEDKTNAEPNCSRNRIRLEVLPRLEEVHPGAAEKLCAFSRRMEELDRYLYEQAGNFVLMPATILEDIPEALFPYAVKLCLFSLGEDKSLSEKILNNLYRLLCSGENGGRCALTQTVYAERCYDRIVFRRARTEQFHSVPFAFGEFEVGDYRISVAEIPQSDSALFGGAGRIPRGAVIRTPREGDFFRKFGGGSKKLCDLFTDWKIPRSDRQGIPVLADGNRILAVLTRDISEDLRTEEGDLRFYIQTKRIEKYNGNTIGEQR